MKKKIISIILTLTMVLGMVPFTVIPAFATDLPSGATGWVVDSGDNHVWYKLEEKNTKLTIGGTGAMNDYTGPSSAPWYSNRKSIKTVVIESGVTHIGKYAFNDSGYTAFSSITIPSTVTSIESAFNNKSPISSLYIDSIESWCKISFSSNSCNPLYGSATNKMLYVNGENVTNLVIPDTVTEINEYAFHKWDFLTNVTIPSSVMTIGGYAFRYCTSLTSLTIPSSVTSIGNAAFAYCSNLASVTVKAKNAPTLEKAATFGQCANPLSIYVPAGSINSYESSLWNSISNRVFVVAHTVEAASTENGTVTVDKDWFPSDTYTTASETVTVTATPDEGYALKSLVYNDGTKDYDITATKTFTMPTANVTVTAVFEEAAPHEHTFADTWSSNANGHWHACTATGCDVKAEDISTHTTDGFKYSTHVEENKDFVCDDCGYEDRDGAAAAGFEYNDYDGSTILSYYSGSASEIVIPGWTTGTYGAFNANENITKVTIPASVEEIGGEAFRECHSLESVTFEEGSKLKTIGSCAFDFCENLAEINLDTCQELETIRERAFSGTGLAEINLNAFQNLKTIGEEAFEGTGLTSVNIPASVTEIGNYAFETDEPLTNLYLNWTEAEDIVEFEFYGEVGKTTLHIPEGTRSIYKNTSFSRYLPCVVTLVNATYDGQSTFTYYIDEGGEYPIEAVKIDGKEFKEFVLDGDYEGVEIIEGILYIFDGNADITVTAVYDTLVAVPAGIDPITYDGEEHTPYEETVAYTVSGDVTGKEVGKYTVTFELKDGYVWAEEFEGAITWEIASAHVHGEGASAVTFGKAINTEADLGELFEKGGSGYLANNIDCTAALTVAEGKTVDLCLNDKVLNLNKKGNITVAPGATLNLYDCGEGTTRYYDKDATGLWTLNTALTSGNCSTTGGIITGGTGTMTSSQVTFGGGIILYGKLNLTGGNIVGNKADKQGGGVNINSGGSFTMQSGNIVGNTANAGGGVYVINTAPRGSFTMKGGLISYNRAIGDNGNGGGVCAVGDFTMEGGSIKYNSADGNGGGVRVTSAGVFTMTAGEISDNTAAGNGGGIDNGGTLTLGGTAVVTGNTAGSENKTANNLYLPTNKTVTIASGNDAPKSGFAVGVTTQTPPTKDNPVKLTTNGTQADINFTPDNTDYEVKFNASGYLELVTANKFTATSLALDGDIQMYLHMNVAEDARDGAKVKMKIGNGSEITQSLSSTSEGDYIVSITTNAIQMAETVSATLLDKQGTELATSTDSVVAYNGRVQEQSKNDKEKALVNALVNYGHYAQVALSQARGWKIGKDYAETPSTQSLISSAAELQQFKPLITGSSESVTGLNISLLLDHETSICVYLTTEDGNAPTDVTVDGQTVSPMQSGNQWLVRINNIDALNLGTVHTVTADGYTFYLSALTYGAVMSDEANVNAMRALLDYYKAALAFGNKTPISASVAQSEYVYTGSPIVPQLSVNGDYTVEWDGDLTNVGTYHGIVKGTGNYFGSASVTVTIVKAKIAVPTAVTGLVYNGEEQTGVAEGNGYTVTGNTATNAGSYTATASLSDMANTEWETCGTEDKAIPWSIGQATLQLGGYTAVYIGSSFVLTPGDFNGTVTHPQSFTAEGDYDFTFTPSDPNYAPRTISIHVKEQQTLMTNPY